MILGTHNTMSYRNPKQWYLHLFKFIARCQNVDYQTQHEKYGVNCFDLRLYWDEKGELEFRHGIFRYYAPDFHTILKYCNDNKMYVRILLEARVYSKNITLNTAKFKRLCRNIEEEYKGITFYGGYNVSTSEIIYDFNNNIKEIGFYSSVTSLFDKTKSKLLKVIDDWCPWFYAKLKNHKNKIVNEKKYANENVCIQYDFIDIE